MSDRPATRGRRLLRLAGMTAQVATRYATSRLKSAFQSSEDAERDREVTHTRTGEIIAKTLGELKGAAMKVGQMASAAGDLLPREIAEALRTLQREAPPMPYEVIAEQIEREFSAVPESLFRSFERVPFASASIGQVHRAVTDDGRDVVVKVQYPGVDRAVDSDLAHLKLALRASGLIKIKRAALDAVFAEIRARLREELDYCIESDNVRWFHDYYRDHPKVVVPQVVGERSSQRVLTLTYEPGDSLTEAEAYPQEVRDQLGEGLFELVADQVFHAQRIHADPNPANFAFRLDGTIVLYDFGCVKTLDPSMVRAYARAVRAGLDGDEAGIEAGLVELGARDLEGPHVPLEVYGKWRNILGRPFLVDGPYDFGSSALQLEAVKMLPGFITKYAGAFQPPAQLVFLDRVIVGHYGTLRRLKSRFVLRSRLFAHLAAFESSNL